MARAKKILGHLDPSRIDLHEGSVSRNRCGIRREKPDSSEELRPMTLKAIEQHRGIPMIDSPDRNLPPNANDQPEAAQPDQTDQKTQKNRASAPAKPPAQSTTPPRRPLFGT